MAAWDAARTPPIPYFRILNKRMGGRSGCAFCIGRLAKRLGSSLVPLGSLSAAHANGAGGVAKIAWFQLGSTLVPRFAVRISLSRGCKNRLAPAWFRNAPCAFCALGAAQVKSGRGTGRRSKNALKRIRTPKCEDERTVLRRVLFSN